MSVSTDIKSNGKKIKEESSLDFMKQYETKTFAFIPVKYLYAHTYVLTVIPHRKF